MWTKDFYIQPNIFRPNDQYIRIESILFTWALPEEPTKVMPSSKLITSDMWLFNINYN